VIPAETRFFIDLAGHLKRGQQRALLQIEQDLGIQLPPLTRRVRSPAEVIALYEEIAGRYVTRMQRDGVRYFGDKSPGHLLVLPRVLRHYPDARIIIVYRDGRDVASSLTRMPWAPPSLYVNFAVWLRHHRWQMWARDHLTTNLHEVRYEDFVSDPDTACRAVCDFLDLRFEPAMVEGSGNREGIPDWEREWKERATEPIGRDRVELWRTELDPREVERLERWGRNALTSLGYEVSTAKGPPPLWFHLKLLCEHTLWRVRCGIALAARELLPVHPDEPHLRRRNARGGAGDPS
jgi:hypothetical protein